MPAEFLADHDKKTAGTKSCGNQGVKETAEPSSGAPVEDTIIDVTEEPFPA